MNALLCVLVLPILGGTPGDPGEEAETPSAKDLIKLVRPVDSWSKKFKSLEFSMTYHLEDRANLDYHVSYEAPDHYRLSIRDLRDGAPLLLLSDHTLMIYDPIKGAVVYSEFASLDMSFCTQHPDPKNVGPVESLSAFGNKMQLSEEKPPSHLLCAFAPIPSDDWETWGVHKKAKDCYVLECIDRKGNKMKASFDKESEYPVTSIEFFRKDEDQPIIALSEIAINEPIHHQSFRIPSREELGSKVEVVDFNPTSAGLGASARTFVSMSRAYVYRDTMRDPEKRKTMMKSHSLLGKIVAGVFLGGGFDGADFERMVERDDQVSKTLSKMTVPWPSAMIKFPKPSKKVTIPSSD